MSNVDCLTRSVTGRVAAVAGGSSVRPRNSPAMIAHGRHCSGRGGRVRLACPRGRAVGGMSDCLCDRCAGLCCRYFALPIDNPETRRDYDNIRWYLLHEKVVVFVEDGQWFIGILNKCKALQPDNRCGVYETRPKICRGYTPTTATTTAGTTGTSTCSPVPTLSVWTLQQLEQGKGDSAEEAAAKPSRGAGGRRSARRLAEGRPLPPRADGGAGRRRRVCRYRCRSCRRHERGRPDGSLRGGVRGVPAAPGHPVRGRGRGQAGAVCHGQAQVVRLRRVQQHGSEPAGGREGPELPEPVGPDGL